MSYTDEDDDCILTVEILKQQWLENMTEVYFSYTKEIHRCHSP